jgi:hypothetical protein
MPLDSHHTQRTPVNIYTLLDHLKIRKAMYLGNEYNFNSLNNFITGFTMAASDGQLESKEYPNFTYFSTWLLGHLKKHFGLSGGWHWQIKNRNPNDDTKAFEEFFEFLEVFKMSKASSKTIIIDKEALEFSKSSGVKRFNIVDGESIPLEDRPYKISWTTISNSSTVWVDYLDQMDEHINAGFWRTTSKEAMKDLVREFGKFKNNWVDQN